MISDEIILTTVAYVFATVAFFGLGEIFAPLFDVFAGLAIIFFALDVLDPIIGSFPLTTLILFLGVVVAAYGIYRTPSAYRRED